jgi:hypothetical protein
MANAYVLPVLSYMYVVPLQLRDIMLARPGTCTRPSHFARIFLSLMLPPWWSCPSELYAVRLTLSGSIHKPTASTRHEVLAASMTNACQGREGRESCAGGCQHGAVLRTNSLGTDVVVAPCGCCGHGAALHVASLHASRDAVVAPRGYHRDGVVLHVGIPMKDAVAASRGRCRWRRAARRHALRGRRRRAPWASWRGHRATR